MNQSLIFVYNILVFDIVYNIFLDVTEVLQNIVNNGTRYAYQNIVNNYDKKNKGMLLHPPFGCFPRS